MTIIRRDKLVLYKRKGGSLNTALEVIIPHVGRQIVKGINKKRLLKLLSLLGNSLIQHQLLPFLKQQGSKAVEKVLDYGYDKAKEGAQHIMNKINPKPEKPIEEKKEGQGIKKLLNQTSKMLLSDILKGSKVGNGLAIL